MFRAAPNITQYTFIFSSIKSLGLIRILSKRNQCKNELPSWSFRIKTYMYFGYQNLLLILFSQPADLITKQ